MRRALFPAALGLLLIPVVASAQPRLLVGGGFSAPNGDISNVADPGFHFEAGLSLRLPTLPLSIRGDGAFHRMGAASADVASTDILAGALSLVFHLPGVGLQPYLLTGLGSYRTEWGPVDDVMTETDTGYHGGFGVAVGGLGLGGFAEIRYVHIDGPASARLIPLTLGLRF